MHPASSAARRGTVPKRAQPGPGDAAHSGDGSVDGCWTRSSGSRASPRRGHRWTGDRHMAVTPGTTGHAVVGRTPPDALVLRLLRVIAPTRGYALICVVAGGFTMAFAVWLV